MRTHPEVRVVVLDGLDWAWCWEHRSAEAAPLFAIGERGAFAPLRSTEAPVTSDAVAALLAGRDVRLHWVTADRYTNSQDLIRTRPWLYEAARHGLRVGLVNVPLTWPAFRVPDGSWMVSGYPVGRTDDARLDWRWPYDLPGLDAYPIRAVIADSAGGPGGAIDVRPLQLAEAEIVRWVEDDAPPADVEVVWLRSADAAGHHHWGTPRYAEAVAYLAGLAELLAYRPATTIVISDHGFDAVSSQRCAAYMATEHGPTTRAAGLSGGHAMEGILFAAGKRIVPRGLLPEQRLTDVAAGLFALLDLPPAPGMEGELPAWAVRTTPEDDDAVRCRMRALGYVE